MTLREIAADPVLMEIGRKAVEDTLVDLRDSGIFVLRNNGCVIRTKDGKDSHIIRLGPEQAVRIALDAIATHLGEPHPGPEQAVRIALDAIATLLGEPNP